MLPPTGLTHSVQIELNGELTTVTDGCSVAELVTHQGLDGRRIAVEVNGSIVPGAAHGEHALAEGDRVEIVHAIGGGQPPAHNTAETTMSDPATQLSANQPNDALVIAGQTFSSRLLVGTGKYRDLAQAEDAITTSGAEIVTFAVRRANIGQNPDAPNLLNAVPPERFTLLPNTAGCYSANEAVRTCRLARELLDGHNLVKLEVLGDSETLYPDMTATFEAAEVLVADGFDVMVYCIDDPIACKRLEEAGCVAVMPLAAPIGSGLGIQNRYNMMTIVENASVPILVDAGVGTASDAAIAMELGCDGVLMNTAIAKADDPVRMARAMRHGIIAGREAWLAGRVPRRRNASASSPMTGLSV